MEFFSTEIIVSLITLTFLEIVLGIDNIVFISIVSGRLPALQQRRQELLEFHWPSWVAFSCCWPLTGLLG